MEIRMKARYGTVPIINRPYCRLKLTRKVDIKKYFVFQLFKFLCLWGFLFILLLMIS